jgi:cysteinyl-tRNA synthetase
MRLYNTLGRRFEEFSPVEGNIVKMYVCGPTVYDYIHIGHARSFVSFDALSRYLRVKGFDVIRVQNITDIDDKIIRRAIELGKEWKEVVNYYTMDYLEALKFLKVKIDIHPTVTSHISDIIEFIQKLIDKGNAYVSNNSVYFNVDTFPSYGILSNTKKEQWKQEEEYLSEKRNPYDFALWKASKPGEPYWESPWGKGRPGWHIECSTMSSKYLGERIDIHGGGQDLIFPHHENEIAQSESLFGYRWVKYWLHVGYLTVNKEKMSKSLGNIITLRDLRNKYDYQTIRLWLLSSHYRSQLEFNDSSLEQAKASLVRLKDAVISLLRISSSYSHYLREKEMSIIKRVSGIINDYDSSLESDFNTASALSLVYEMVSLSFKEIIPSESAALASLSLSFFKKFNDVFGVIDDVIYQEGKKREEDLINLIIDLRKILRERKEYNLSDDIRERLLRIGIRLLDKGEETTWSYA